MADVVVTLKLMPSGTDVNFDTITEKSSTQIKQFSGSDDIKVEKEPIAFGLEALKLTFIMDEEKGSTEDLEKSLTEVDGVQSVDVIDVRRTIG
jgi:translation elongation factor aEF-1 beta|tara:strand:+ start:1087 stop:1365 length:279 start_codon:yes stop_codon:yes gene_type:complete